MKTLQWYPGHIAKAMKMMEEQVRLCDGVIYVLDARCPASSYNPNLKKMFGSKPVLFVLNKCDLADGRQELFLQFMRGRGLSCVKLNATDSGSRRSFTAALSATVEEKRRRDAEKGYSRTFRFMVCGVPNTGKSTVINLLAGEGRAKTGDKAGVTRAKQWIRCDGFELLDTPGTTPPSFASQKLARRLAYVGGLNDDILDMDDIALALLEEIYGGYPDRLKSRYGVEGEGLTPLDMLEGVCARRGFILKGGEYDYERGVRAVVDDFRKGRLGAMCLDALSDAEEVF